MNLLQTVLAFMLAIGTLIVIHELGHYWVARWCGVKVLRFSVGMGKVIFSRRFGPDRTEWAISVLPLGGYVKMLDAREQDLGHLTPEELKREFTRQPVSRRMAIVAAGPLANFLLAILLFAGLYMIGVPEPSAKLRAVPEQTAAYAAGLRGGETVTAINGQSVENWADVRWQLLQLAVEGSTAELVIQPKAGDGATRSEASKVVTLSLKELAATELEGDFLSKLGIMLARPKAVLGEPVPGGVASEAGLQPGDLIQRVDGMSVLDGLALVELIRQSPGKPLLFEGLRGDRPFTSQVTPQSITDNGETIGRIGVTLPLQPDMVVTRNSFFEAMAKGAQRTWDTSILTLKMLGKMIVGEASWKNITGPITIADYAGQTARIGLISYISFIAFVSISLGVMNLLPIPVLDGGHLLYYSVEVLTGKPVSARVGEITQRAGVGILASLMLVAVFNDIVRLAT
jgi:regulator of sigma E protease